MFDTPEIPPKHYTGPSRFILGVIVLILLVLAVGYVLFVGSRPRGHPPYMYDYNNMLQIAMANICFHHVRYKSPPAYTRDDEGNLMHNWTVFLLREVDYEQRFFYENYRWDEPWNGPNNSQLPQNCPSVLRGQPATPEARKRFNADLTLSFYVRVVPKDYDTRPDRDALPPVIIEDLHLADHWLKPRVVCLEDMLSDPAKRGKPSGQGGVHPGKILILAADGKVYFIPDTTPSEIVLMLTTVEGMKKLKPVKKDNSILTTFDVI